MREILMGVVGAFHVLCELLTSLTMTGCQQKRTERASTRTTIRRLFRELPAKIEEMWSDGLRNSVRASTFSVDGAPMAQPVPA